MIVSCLSTLIADLGVDGANGVYMHTWRSVCSEHYVRALEVSFHRFPALGHG